MNTRRDFLRMGGILAAGAVAGIGRLAVEAEPVARKGGPVIKLGCAAQSYRKYLQGANKSMSMEDFIDLAAELGCEGVELTSYYFPAGFGIDYINKLKRKVFLLGMDVSATSVGNTFTMPAGPKRDEQIEFTKTWIVHAAEMGAPCLRIFGGNVPKNATEQDAMKWVEECITACLPLAEQHGVMLALENHGGLTATADRLLGILDAVKSDWLGVNLDIGNFRTPDPYADLGRAAPYSINTHYKTAVSPRNGPKQPTDAKKVVKILSDAKYRGYLTLEYEGGEEPKTAIPAAIKAMKEALGGLA